MALMGSAMAWTGIQDAVLDPARRSGLPGGRPPARVRARRRLHLDSTPGEATLSVTAHGLVEVFLNGTRVRRRRTRPRLHLVPQAPPGLQLRHRRDAAAPARTASRRCSATAGSAVATGSSGGRTASATRPRCFSRSSRPGACRDRCIMAVAAERHHARRPHGRAGRGLPAGRRASGNGCLSSSPTAGSMTTATGWSKHPLFVYAASRRWSRPAGHPPPRRHGRDRRRSQDQRLAEDRRPRAARHSPDADARRGARPRRARLDGESARVRVLDRRAPACRAGRRSDLSGPRRRCVRAASHDARLPLCADRRRAGGVGCLAVRAVIVHSDIRPVGEFACSDDRLDALHELAGWSLLGNACDIPTDCPQRERSGFTGDWQVFVDAAAMLYDVDAFSAKWLDDLAADQWPDGRVPTVIPNPAGDGPSGVVFEDMSAGSAGWGDAAVIVPWELWRHYGDLDALRGRLPSMRRWVEYAAGAAAGSRHPDRVAARPLPRPTRSSCGTPGSTSASGSSPACHRAPTRPPTTASSRRRSCIGPRGSSRRAPRSSATTSSRRGRAVSPTARATHGATEFVTRPGRLSIESQANYARGLAFDLFAADDRAVGSRAARRAHRGRGRAPRHRIPQHRPAAARARRQRPGRRRFRHAALDRRAVVAGDARPRRDDGMGVVGRGRRRRRRARLAEPLQQGRGGLIPLHAHRRHPPRADSGCCDRRVPPRAHRARFPAVASPGRARPSTPHGPIRSEWRIDDGTFTLEVDIPGGTTRRSRCPTARPGTPVPASIPSLRAPPKGQP